MVVDFTGLDAPIAVARAMGVRVGLAAVDDPADPILPPPVEEVPPDDDPVVGPPPDVEPLDVDPPTDPVADPPPDEPPAPVEDPDPPAPAPDEPPPVDRVAEAPPDAPALPPALAFTGLPLLALLGVAGLLTTGGLVLLRRARAARATAEGGPG